MKVVIIPKAEIKIPAFAVLLFSVFKLNSPSAMPKMLVTPLQIGITPIHKLINPNAVDAIAYSLANRSSGSKLSGSTSIPSISIASKNRKCEALIQFYT